MKALGSVVAMLLAAGAAGCASTDEGGGGAGSASAGKAANGSGCGTRATDDCTPHVPMGRRVRVDALLWSVSGVRTAGSIGDQTYGLGEKADGVFVIVDLKVHSDRDESATLTDEIVQLDIAGNTYKADSDGTIAAIGNGDEPLWFDDIGPDATMRSKVVFDVPRAALRKKISVRFGEIGFGDTKGYIDLPRAALG